jgi:hypothetical protein
LISKTNPVLRTPVARETQNGGLSAEGDRYSRGTVKSRRPSPPDRGEEESRPPPASEVERRPLRIRSRYPLVSRRRFSVVFGNKSGAVRSSLGDVFGLQSEIGNCYQREVSSPVDKS